MAQRRMIAKAVVEDEMKSAVQTATRIKTLVCQKKGGIKYGRILQGKPLLRDFEKRFFQ